MNYGEAEFVYPAFEDAALTNAEVLADGFVTDEDVVRGDNSHGWDRAEFRADASPEFWLGYPSHGHPWCHACVARVTMAPRGVWCQPRP